MCILAVPLMKRTASCSVKHKPFGSSKSSTSPAQLADRYHILDIGLVDGGGLTVYPNGPNKPPHAWVFQSGANSFALGAALGEYTLKHCPKGLAVLHGTTSWGMGGFAAFKLAYERPARNSLSIVRSPRTGPQEPPLSWRRTWRP